MQIERHVWCGIDARSGVTVQTGSARASSVRLRPTSQGWSHSVPMACSKPGTYRVGSPSNLFHPSAIKRAVIDYNPYIDHTNHNIASNIKFTRSEHQDPSNTVSTASWAAV